VGTSHLHPENGCVSVHHPSRFYHQSDAARTSLTSTRCGLAELCTRCCSAPRSVLLACARAGRMDDAAHALVVADKLGLRINAGALQVFPDPRVV
jgi:hypothetical protein